MSKGEANARQRIMSAIQNTPSANGAATPASNTSPVATPAEVTSIANDWIKDAQRTKNDGTTQTDNRKLAQQLQDLAATDKLFAKQIAAALTSQLGAFDVSNQALAWHLKPSAQTSDPNSPLKPTNASGENPDAPKRSSKEQAAIDRGTTNGRLEAAKEWGGEVVDGVFGTVKTAGQLGVVGLNEVPIIGYLVPDGFAEDQAEDLDRKLQSLKDTIKSLPELPQAVTDKYDAEMALAQELENAYDAGQADISVLEEVAKIRAKADAELAILLAELAPGVGLAGKAARLLAKINDGFPGGIKGAIDASKDASNALAEEVRRFANDEIGSIPLSKAALDEKRRVTSIRTHAPKVLNDVVGPPPVGMNNPHAHHILPLKGLGEAQQKLVVEGRAILEKFGIDPDLGIENLVWAPNGNGVHKKASVEALVQDLRNADIDPFATKSKVADILKDHGARAAAR